MQRIDTTHPEVFLIEPAVHGDDRGFFFESYQQQRWQDAGAIGNFVQDNHSRSTHGTLRGLHYQLRNPQAKLCRVIRGAVLDVAADIRLNSPHFGHVVTALLSETNKLQIYVPRGFAHGFLVTTESADFLYKCDQYYQPNDE